MSTYTQLAFAAEEKVKKLKNNSMAYILLSVLAGMYIGFGILLVFTIAGQLNGAPYTKLIMGATFACALSLVIMAGAELFTGNNLIMTAGLLEKKVSLANVLKVWAVCWVGNLIGSVLLAFLFTATGLYSGATLDAMISAAEIKMSATPIQLLTRGILCNMLVCLAVWCAKKASSDSGKLIMIFWCILAFFTTGFEHSIANMTLLTLSLINNNGSEIISFTGYCYNLLIVTLGNLMGGVLFVGVPYFVDNNKLPS